MSTESTLGLRRWLVAAVAALPPLGQLVEQTIHLPENGYRHAFGELIANYWGNYTIGISIGMASIWALANIDRKYAPWVAGAIFLVGLAAILANEFYGLGPGEPQKLDVIVPLAAVVHAYCFAENIVTSKNFSRAGE